MTSIQPELWVERTASAVAFYAEAFGASVLHQVGEGEDVVAQLGVGNAAFWVASASPDLGRFSPGAISGATSRTLLVVDDPDATMQRSLAAGATRRRLLPTTTAGAWVVSWIRSGTSGRSASHLDPGHLEDPRRPENARK